MKAFKLQIKMRLFMVSIAVIGHFGPAFGQPSFRAFPINDVGFRIQIDGSYSQDETGYFMISYKLENSPDIEYSEPILLLNSGDIIEYTYPINLFSQSSTYVFRVFYNNADGLFSNTRKNSFSQNFPTSGGQVLHGLNQVVSPENAPHIYYLHEGVDFLGSGMDLKCIQGGVFIGGRSNGENSSILFRVYNTQGTGTNQILEFNHCRLNTFYTNLVNYHVAAAQNGISLAMGYYPSVYPNNIFGEVGSHFEINDRNHVHLGYYANYPISTASDILNPLSIYDDNVKKDPNYSSPTILNCNGEPNSFRFSKNSLSGSSTIIDYFSDPIIENDPSVLYGAVDIAVEAIDKQSNSSPWAIPYRMGYRVLNVNQSGAWDLAVPMHILYESDEYLLGNGCVIPPGNVSNPPHCPAIVKALVDWNPDLIQNQELFNERPVYVVTNTKGTSGDVEDISRDDCWATDAHETVTTANGYQEGYEKARCVAEAKFPDGKYKAVVVMDDLVHTGIEEAKEVIVDNFKPYVKQVKVYAINPVTTNEVLIYDGRREWDMSGVLGLVPTVLDANNSSSRIVGAMNPYLQNLRFEVEFSEQMSDLEGPELRISSAFDSPAVLNYISPDKRVFHFLFLGENLSNFNPQNNIHDVVISGKDRAGNSLFGLSDLTMAERIVASSNIPVRAVNGSWSTNGPGTGIEDRSHHFKINFCLEPPEIGGSGATCIAAFFESDVPLTGIDQGETVQFTDLSSGEPTTWLWSFGDGGVSTVQNPQHQYLYPGVYTVSLTVTNSFGTDTHTRVGHVVVNSATGGGGGGNALVVDFAPSTSPPYNVGDEVAFP